MNKPPTANIRARAASNDYDLNNPLTKTQPTMNAYINSNLSMQNA